MSDEKAVIVFSSIHIEKGPEALPLGAASVASAVQAAFRNAGENARYPPVRIVLEEHVLSDSPPLIAGDILGHKPLAVGFSIYSWNRKLSCEAAKMIRAESPAVKLICGGPDVSALPAGLLVSEGGSFDCVIRGEGEKGMVRYLEDFFSGRNTEPVIAEPSMSADELAALPSPWLDGTLDARGRDGVLLELARGCPYRCAYCYESKGEKRVRYFPEERMRDEIKTISRGAPASVTVLDPTFNTDPRRALRILNLIRTEAPDIHWHFEVRAEHLNREQARLFAGLGASLQIGLQSADEKVCERIGRKFNRDLFASRISLLHEAGAAFGLDLIYGLPGDSLAGYRKSLDFALSLYPDHLDMFRLSVLPGTLLHDRAGELGILAEGQAPYLLIAAPAFPREDLNEAEKLSWGTNLFYNTGRAVSWFNQVLYPLGIRPSRFLTDFTAFIPGLSARERRDSLEAEQLQLSFLDRWYQKKGKDYLLPLIWDIVRFHGAWGRALAEGVSTSIETQYATEDVLNSAGEDLEDYIEYIRPAAGRITLVPGKDAPEIREG
ncbi:radical SAM protein [Treponema sp. OttesenSCG-928-L16]|nr:radical SAM protein [Treponema sp. OttesenSCG-928-L16]